MVTNGTIKKKGWRKLSFLTALFLSICIFLTGCTEQQLEDTLDFVVDVLVEANNSENQETVNVNGEMSIYFIDVGQADATLFVQNGHSMLFDSATKSRGDELVEYINNLGIEYIDVLVLSHPHDDHMGGAAEILNNIEVGTVYGPDIFDIESLDTLGWYNDMINAIDEIDEKRNKGIEESEQVSIWNFPKDSDGKFAKFNIGDAIVEFYAPLEEEYSDLNDYSICAKVTFGTVDVLLTADATDNVEKALISKGYNLDIEIFHAGHHGSDTSNSKEFLKAMSPECIVISCGINNRYNHPVKSVVELYKDMNIPVYRTDESGNIIMTTDGTTYSFNKEPGTYKSGAEYKEEKD